MSETDEAVFCHCEEVVQGQAPACRGPWGMTVFALVFVCTGRGLDLLKKKKREKMKSVS